MPAALLMANLQALFHAQDRALLRSPALLVDRVNELLYRSTAPEHYATLFYGVYRGESHEVTYVNFGHPPAVLERGGAAPEECGATALPAGLFAAARCEERRVGLGPGSRLTVCSDGITEADMGEDDRTRNVIEVN